MARTSWRPNAIASSPRSSSVGAGGRRDGCAPRGAPRPNICVCMTALSYSQRSSWCRRTSAPVAGRDLARAPSRDRSGRGCGRSSPRAGRRARAPRGSRAPRRRDRSTSASLGLRAADDRAVAAERADRERMRRTSGTSAGRRQRRRSGTPLTIITTDCARSARIWLAMPAMLISRRSGTLAGRKPSPISVVTSDDRRRRPVELVRQGLDLGDQVVVGASPRRRPAGSTARW